MHSQVADKVGIHRKVNVNDKKNNGSAEIYTGSSDLPVSSIDFVS